MPVDVGQLPLLLGRAPQPLAAMPSPQADIGSSDVLGNTIVRQLLHPAWQESANGTNGREAGFQILRNNGQLGFIKHAYDNQNKRISWLPGPGIIAEFHVHPNASIPQPSQNDRSLADKHKFDIYTGSRQGLYKYDWRTRSISKVLDGLDWLK